MSIEYEVFKKSIVDFKLLENYGFKKEKDYYIYETNILDDSFKVIIRVNERNVSGKIYDLSFDSEYTLFRVEDNIGAFALTIREEYIKLLNEIKDKCFTDKYFVYNQTNRITDYIINKYDAKPEFLWEDENAVFKCSNGKWFGIIMNVSKNKIKGKSEEKVEIINVKVTDEKVLKNKGIYKAYHMNKKSWITIILDDSLIDDEIKRYIDNSFDLIDTKEKVNNEWLMPLNPNYFDVFSYIENTKPLIWKVNKSMKKGDVIYLYIGAPYSSILYKSVIVSDIKEGTFSEYEAVIDIVKKYKLGKYSFKRIGEYGVKSVRGTRRITKELSDCLNND